MRGILQQLIFERQSELAAAPASDLAGGGVTLWEGGAEEEEEGAGEEQSAAQESVGGGFAKRGDGCLVRCSGVKLIVYEALSS